MKRIARRKYLYIMQEGECHRDWGCGIWIPIQGLDEAHLENLGMGASRNNETDPRNQLGKTVLLCRACHQAQERLVSEMHGLWKDGYCDYVSPEADNYHGLLEAVQGGRVLKMEKEGGEM